MQLGQTSIRWRFGIIAGIFMALVALYPQIRLIYQRGAEWNGNYAYNDLDEAVYAAYLQALIDGRPRRSDPYFEKGDDTPERVQKESLFSIQFAAPYSLALPARLFGLNAPWTMTLGGALAAFLAALALFWLIAAMTDDDYLAACGALFVLCFGALAAGEGALSELVNAKNTAYPYFPFLRRYIPAVAFPFLFTFIACVWKIMTTKQFTSQILSLVGAALSFIFLLYSYFFLWTTAAAWLVCLMFLWFAVRPKAWRGDAFLLVFLTFICGISAIPYVIMLGNRSKSMDDVQLLEFTRRFDLFRTIEILGLFTLLFVVIAIFRRSTWLRERFTIFVISFALTPFILFNQQVITGQSLQPIHYQIFTGNYVALLGLFLGFYLLWRGRIEQTRLLPTWAAILLASGTVLWASVESFYTVRVLDQANVMRDEGFAAARILRRRAAEEGLNPHQTIVFTNDVPFGDDVPSTASMPMLWARHQHIFNGMTAEENKRRYYQQLYYSNWDADFLESNLVSGRDFLSRIAFFGWDTGGTRLSFEKRDPTLADIRRETALYRDYVAKFSAQDAAQTPLSFVIVRTDAGTDFTNLDKWFERDEGENIGSYTIYRVKLRKTDNAVPQ